MAEFIGLSNVISEPIPEEYRAKIYPNNKDLLIQELINTEPSYRNYLLMMNGHSFKNNTLHVADVIEYPINISEIEKKLFEKNDVIYIDWYKHILYKKTKYTRKVEYTMSYGFYEKLYSQLIKANGKELDYFPPSMLTAPEYGLVNCYDAKLCLNNMDTLFEQFKNNELFIELYKIIQLASECGIIIIY
jgi:hypothetical protein